MVTVRQEFKKNRSYIEFYTRRKRKRDKSGICYRHFNDHESADRSPSGYRSYPYNNMNEDVSGS